MKRFLKIIIIFVLIFLVGCEKVDKNSIENKPGEKSGENQQIEESIYPGLKVEDTQKYENGFYVYYNKKGSEFCIYDELEKCGPDKVYIKTETKEASKYYEYQDKYVFYKDNNKIKVYDDKTKENYVINLPATYYSYNFCIDNLTNDLVGVIYSEVDGSFQTYYSIKLDKKLYDKKYQELMFLSDKYLQATSYECKENGGYCNQSEIFLLSALEEKENLSYKLKVTKEGYYEEHKSYGLLRNEKGTFIYLETYVDAAIFDVIYNEKYEKVVSNTGEFDADIGSDGNLYVNSKGIVTSYDQNGYKVKTSHKFNVIQIIGEYMVVIDDNKLLLINIDGESVEISDWSKKYNEYNRFLSDWYRGSNKNGIYIAIKDSRVKIDDVWTQCQKDKTCLNTTKDELSEYSLGYEYKVNPVTKEISRKMVAVGYLEY